MAHLVETMFFVGEKPWHGLGIDATNENIKNSDKALELAGLNWEVSKKKIYIDDNGQPKEVLSKFATVRTSDNSILGIVGDNYTIMQNNDAYKSISSFLETGCKFETGGSLKEGRSIFALLKLPQINFVEELDNYILLSNSHDGTTALSFGLTQIRVVCNNTLTQALNSEASKLLKIRHTQSIKDGLELAKTSINLITKQIEGDYELYKSLLAKDVTKDSLDQYFRLVCDIREIDKDKQNDNKTFNKLHEIFENGIGLSSLKPSLYRAWQSVTEYTTHHKKFRSAENRLINCLEENLGNKSLQIAKELLAA